MASRLDDGVEKLKSKRLYNSSSLGCADMRRAVNGATDIDGVQESTWRGIQDTEKDNDDSDDEAGVNGGKWRWLLKPLFSQSNIRSKLLRKRRRESLERRRAAPTRRRLNHLHHGSPCRTSFPLVNILRVRK